MHPLHLLFSVPVGLYSTAWRIFACRGEPPKKSRPPVADLPVDAFGVRRYMRAILREDHVSHLEGVTPSVWQAMPCERVGGTAEVGHDLDYQGLTFVAPEGAARLLDTAFNITEASHLLFPILVVQAPPFEEKLYWLQLLLLVPGGTYFHLELSHTVHTRLRKD